MMNRIAAIEMLIHAEYEQLRGDRRSLRRCIPMVKDAGAVLLAASVASMVVLVLLAGLHA